jgi:hypothetical protein
MEEFKTNIVYTIKEIKDWRGERIAIKSNLSDDKEIECILSESLVKYLIKESAVLKPDQLLLGFAEMQKRGLESTIEGLNDLELAIKSNTDSVFLRMEKSINDYDVKYETMMSNFQTVGDKLANKLSKDDSKISKMVEKIEGYNNKLTLINSFGLERLAESLKSLIQLAEKDKDLLTLVAGYYDESCKEGVK